MKTKKFIEKAMSSTVLQSIHIAAAQDAGSCLDSKFGGVFYLPQGQTIPVSTEGEEMQFLAQINFSQIPPLEGFPQNGILQFFVDTDINRFHNKVYQENQRELYKVLFYPEPSAAFQQEVSEQNFTASQTILTVLQGKERFSWEEYQALPKEKRDKPHTLESRRTEGHLNAPWKKGKMVFELQDEIATLSLGMEGLKTDFGYEKQAGQLKPSIAKRSGYDFEHWESDTDDFCWDFGNWGCKIGGHPAIRGADGRLDTEECQKYAVLLFQYDLSTRQNFEQDTFDFFIKPEDLAALKFDDVLLYWHQCY